MYVHMQCSLVASWGWKGPSEITGIQICSLPVQFSQFKHNQPAFARWPSKALQCQNPQ